MAWFKVFGGKSIKEKTMDFNRENFPELSMGSNNCWGRNSRY